MKPRKPAQVASMVGSAMAGRLLAPSLNVRVERYMQARAPRIYFLDVHLQPCWVFSMAMHEGIMLSAVLQPASAASSGPVQPPQQGAFVS